MRELVLAFTLVALGLTPFGLLYGYSVLVLPIQSILTPNDPYALKQSHAVWALSGSLLASGAVLYFGAAMIRRDAKGTLVKSGLTSGIGLMLQGVAMDLAKHHRAAAIVIYYVGQLLFGTACGLSTLVALIAALAWFGKLYPDWPGLGSGVFGPVLAMETSVFAWTFYAFNDKLGIGDLCRGCREGRVDIFFYVAAAVTFATQFAAICLWELPEPAATVREDRERAVPRISLSKAEVARTWTFWGYFWVYFVTLLPGFGLKLMASPVVYFTYGFSDAASTAFTCLYLAAYGLGRFFTPVLSRERFDRARRIYQYYSLISAVFLLVSPATINGLPSDRWPAPLPFCCMVVAQGFLLGGIKGLMPGVLRHLWCWMAEDPQYAHYDPLPAFNLVLGMNNLALCLAAAIGPGTAWVAYVGSPDVSQADLDSGRATGKDFEYWYYAAGVVQLIAAGVLVFPNMVPRFEPPVAKVPL